MRVRWFCNSCSYGSLRAFRRSIPLTNGAKYPRLDEIRTGIIWYCNWILFLLKIKFNLLQNSHFSTTRSLAEGKSFPVLYSSQARILYVDYARKGFGNNWDAFKYILKLCYGGLIIHLIYQNFYFFYFIKWFKIFNLKNFFFVKQHLI